MIKPVDILEQIVDRRGTLKRILAQQCILGRPNASCPLCEWRIRDGVEFMTDSLVATLLLKHLECDM